MAVFLCFLAEKRGFPLGSKRKQAVLFGQQIVNVADLCQRCRQRAVSERIGPLNHTKLFIENNAKKDVEQSQQ